MPPRSASNATYGGRWNDDESACSSEVSVISSSRKNLTLKRSKPPKKQLRFNFNRNQVFPIPHLDNLTDEQVSQIWFQSEEYAEIKSGYQLIIFRMESGEFVEDDEHTARGLEYRTQQGGWSRYENKRDAYNAVLDEQDRQWKNERDDHDEIGRLYLEHSAKCAKAAAARGAQDAKEAKEICKDIIKKRRARRRKSKKLDKEALARASDDSSGPDAPKQVPRPEQVRQLLRQPSLRGRDLVRNDMQLLQQESFRRRGLQKESSIRGLMKQESFRGLSMQKQESIRGLMQKQESMRGLMQKQNSVRGLIQKQEPVRRLPVKA